MRLLTVCLLACAIAVSQAAPFIDDGVYTQGQLLSVVGKAIASKETGIRTIQNLVLRSISQAIDAAYANQTTWGQLVDTVGDLMKNTQGPSITRLQDVTGRNIGLALDSARANQTTWATLVDTVGELLMDEKLAVRESLASSSQTVAMAMDLARFRKITQYQHKRTTVQALSDGQAAIESLQTLTSGAITGAIKAAYYA